MDLVNLSILVHSNHVISNNNCKRPIYCMAHPLSSIHYMTQVLQNFDGQIYIIGNNTCMSGVSDVKKNLEKYREYGINIEIIPYDKKDINTRIESEIVVQYMNQNGHNEFIIVAPPYHLLRSYLTMASCIIDFNWNIIVFPQSATCSNWKQTIVTHQGKTNASAENVVNLEIERIDWYIRKGDIRPVSTLLKGFLNL